VISAADILKANILIVDDQEANVALLQQMLGGAGYVSVTATRNPRAVVELYRRNRYDLILLDLEMPGMDGFEVMQGLKAIETTGYLPVLVLTAEPEHKLRALKAGAKDFVSKPFGLAEILLRVYNMLEIRLLHLESKRLYERVVAEQKLAERLRRNVLPRPITERLKNQSEMDADDISDVIADTFPEVTVLFADLVEFRRFSAGLSPAVRIDVLNEIFASFDHIADVRGLEKIKTIGDAYMAAAGLPTPVPDHSARAAHMALDMIEVLDRFNGESSYKVTVRIGISTGAAVAGVTGKRKFLYDLWGDGVNPASQRESHGGSGRIQVTDSTRRQLGESFALEESGLIEAKGQGEMHRWFLNSRIAPVTSPPAAVGRDSHGR
jgi:adenylate cyclase